MFSALPRLSRIVLASALASWGSAVALAQPAPGPVPMPYPLTNDASAAGPAWLELKGEGGDRRIEIFAMSWGASNPPVGSADPQEGGEVVGGVDDRSTAEAAARKRGAGRVSVSDITVTKKADKSSPVVLSKVRPGTTVPGKIEYPNLSVAPSPEGTPAPSGTVTLLVPAGSCVQGTRYPAVTLRLEGKAYELQDVTVAECGPETTARGKKAQKEKLDYIKFEMKEILVTG